MLAFRPADADDAPRPVLKPVGISQATADSTGAVAAAATVAPSTVKAAVQPPAPVAMPQREPEPEPEPVRKPVVDQPGEHIDLPWNDPVSAPVATAPESVAVPAAAAAGQPGAHEPPPLEDDGYNPAGMDRDDEPPLDEDYYAPEVDPVGFSYLDELAEHVHEPDEVANVPEPLPASQPATGLALQWLELFPQLPISGMTGNIAANCSLIAMNGDDWLLHLDPAQGALFNSTQQRRLNEALDQHFGRAIRLSIELVRPEQETPAQAAARKRAERQREAEEAIDSDPLIQQMIRQFGATVRQDSIEPVDALVSQGQ
jgi:DNA polymerase III subunit gamma/tau